jgi:hypothetical protein
MEGRGVPTTKETYIKKANDNNKNLFNNEINTLYSDLGSK